MTYEPSEGRSRIAAGLTWITAGSLVLAVHAGVIVALVHQSEPVVMATGGEPAVEVDLEPVEGERAPDERSAETSGDPAIASAAAADAAAAAASETAAAEPVAATPPPPTEPPKVEPVPPPPPEPPKVEPVPPPPEPARVEPVPPPPKPPKVEPLPPPSPEPARVEPLPPPPTRKGSHASEASAAAAATQETAPAVQRLSAGREAAWRGLLVAHLNRFRRFPRGLGSGTTRVGFTIDVTGRVTATDIVTGSGDGALDAVARALLEQASPLPPPPAGVSGKGLSFVVPIHFDGRRS